MKVKIPSLILAFASLCSVNAYGQSVSDLPTVTKENVTYYQYRVASGETVAQIADKFGWDSQTFYYTNAAIVNHLKAGDVVYYPVNGPKVTPKGNAKASITSDTKSALRTAMQNASTDEKASKLAESMNKNGGIPDRQQPLTSAPAPGAPASGSASASASVGSATANVQPSQRNPLVGLDPNMLMEYTVQEGDNPAIVAENYNTTVRDIFILNRGVSETNFTEGAVIMLLPNSKDGDVRTMPVTLRNKVGSTTYKCTKEDTWESVAAANGVTVEELKADNPSLKSLKKGKKISVPTISETVVWRDMAYTDPREATASGRREIYEEVQGTLSSSLQATENEANFVILTSTASSDSKRDKEFLRGFMLGVQELGIRNRKIGIKVIELSDNLSLAHQLGKIDASTTDMIFATYDKEFPAELIAFGRDNDIDIINVFDAKSNGADDSHNFFQVLLPTATMNAKIADEVWEDMGKSTYIFIDDSNDSESVNAALKKKIKASGSRYYDLNSVSALRDYKFADFESYVLVPDCSKKAEISEALSSIKNLREANSAANIRTLARPSWIVYGETYEALYKAANLYLPSRIYVNYDDEAYKEFTSQYQATYNESLLKSFPAYAPMGYDVARYFIDSQLINHGDFNKACSRANGLQIDFDFRRDSNWSGFVNRQLYLIHYNPSGLIEKIKF